MNKRELVRYLEGMKIPFVATLDNADDAMDEVVRHAKLGGNVQVAVLMYHNSVIQHILDQASTLEVAETEVDVEEM